MKAMVKVLLVIMALSMPTAALAIGISFNASSGEILEDCALFATMAGAAPRYAVPLGDFNLSSVTAHRPPGNFRKLRPWLRAFSFAYKFIPHPIAHLVLLNMGKKARMGHAQPGALLSKVRARGLPLSTVTSCFLFLPAPSSGP
jgi:hypothetical protein